MNITVAVIGAGRMGSVVARQLPPKTKRIIINRHLDKAAQLAQAIGGVPADSLEAAKEADLVAVVLPTPEVNPTVEKLLDVVKKGAVIANMATTAVISPELRQKRDDVAVVDARIIGHAKSITKGEPAIVVVKTEDKALFDFIKSQLPGFTGVVQGNADLVSVINTIGSTEAVRAALAVRKQCQKLNIPAEWTDVVIRTVCAGTMKAYVENDIGHFVRELAKKLESEE